MPPRPHESAVDHGDGRSTGREAEIDCMTNERADLDRLQEAMALADRLITLSEELNCWVAAALVEQAKHLLVTQHKG
jgi:hypothetical protein